MFVNPRNFIFSNIAQPPKICPSKYLGYMVYVVSEAVQSGAEEVVDMKGGWADPDLWK